MGGALGDGLVGLAEILAALGVADERSLDPELEQHPRRDLAGERALVVPVDVLGVHRDAAGDRFAQRCERRAHDDVDARRRVERGAEVLRLGAAS